MESMELQELQITSERPYQEQVSQPSRDVAPQGQMHRLVARSLIACWVFALLYLLRPDLSLRMWIAPRQPIFQVQNQGYGRAYNAEIRPRIELNPKDHAYRQPVTHYLDWRVTNRLRRPDGLLKQVYLINNLFPGPTIEARSGDRLIINVTNALLADSIAFHWHGLRISNAMDGAASVTQCPIAAGGRFTYNFTIPADQSGTFWYHSHVGTSRADGLYGGLIIHAPASNPTVRGLKIHNDLNRFGYEKELLLLIGDWYRQSGPDVLAWYMDPGHAGVEPEPSSLLINGEGHFNCSNVNPYWQIDCIDRPANSSFLDLDSEVTYRIRMVNTGSIAGFTMTFDNERLDLIQLDCIDVARPKQEESNSIGKLFPGQRMDFVLRPSTQPSPSSSMMVTIDWHGYRIPNLELTSEQIFPIHYTNTPISSDTPFPSPTPFNEISLSKVPSHPSVLTNLPLKAQATYVVYTKTQVLSFNGNRPSSEFNLTAWKPQKDPAYPLIALPRTKWDSNQFAISTGPEPIWIDFVVNNLDEGSHPFHLHGHTFYVLTTHQPSYWGSYNPFSDIFPPGLESAPNKSQPYDLMSASYRDTVMVPYRGYAVLRFRAEKPGVWVFHCHTLWHMVSGMAMIFDVLGDPGGEVAHESGFEEGRECSVLG